MAVFCSSAKELNSSVTWMANSLVGTKINAWIFLSWGITFSIIGIPKAAVLPVPVWALPIRSFLLFNKNGIVLDWIGVGSSKPFFSQWIKHSFWKP